MIFLRKYSHVMALLACSLAWGHARRAEAQPSQMRLALAADDQRPTVKNQHPPELAAALRLYEQLEYEAALGQLAHAKSVAVGTEVRVLIWLYEGIILANLGQMDRSREAFRSGLRLQPSSVLPIEVSPKIAQFFQDVRQQEQPATSPPGSPSPKPTEPVALKSSQPPSPESPTPPLAGAAVTPSPGPLPLPERETVTPKPSPAEAALPHKEVVPWEAQAPPPPDKSRSVNPYHVVFGVGSAMALSGIALYAALEQSNPQEHANLKFAAGVTGLWGLGLAFFGGVGSWGQRDSQPVGQLQSRRFDVSARFSF